MKNDSHQPASTNSLFSNTTLLDSGSRKFMRQSLHIFAMDTELRPSRHETIQNRGLSSLSMPTGLCGGCRLHSRIPANEVISEHAINARVRTCNSKCAPRWLHRICCRFTIRLLITWLIVDSTNAVEIVSPCR